MNTQNNWQSTIDPEDKDRLVKLICEQLGDPSTHRYKLFMYLVQDEVLDGQPPTESELLHALFKQDDVTTKKQARAKVKEGGKTQVRRAKSELVHEFLEFNSSDEGRRQPLQIAFRPRTYGLVITSSDVHVRRFWNPYLDTDPDQPVLIIYPETLFYRAVNHRYFVRHLDLNSKEEPHVEKLKFIPRAHRPLQVSRLFVSAGDVSGVLFITRWFERVGVHTDHAIAHLTSYPFLANKNLVMFGNTRTDPHMDLMVYDNGFNFRIESDRIINQVPIEGDPESDVHGNESDPSGPREYIDSHRAPGKLRGLLYRMYDEDLEACVTIIASNGGRFQESLAHSLTDEREVKEFLDYLGLDYDLDPRDKFEVLLEVQVEREEETPRPKYRFAALSKRIYKKRAD